MKNEEFVKEIQPKPKPIHQLVDLSSLRVPDRIELLKLLKFTGKEVGVEIGVARGFFSEAILRYTSLKTLYSIDPWSRPVDTPLDDAHTSTIEFYLETLERLRPYGDRSITIRLFSHQAVSLFDDGSLDFIYIDGDHCYDTVVHDLSDWYPKVKPGGIFSGHDYAGNCNGVMRAVDEFLRRENLPLNITNCDEVAGDNSWTVRSWYVVKP